MTQQLYDANGNPVATPPQVIVQQQQQQQQQQRGTHWFVWLLF